MLVSLMTSDRIHEIRIEWKIILSVYPLLELILYIMGSSRSHIQAYVFLFSVGFSFISLFYDI